jgi:hypothetical protein
VPSAEADLDTVEELRTRWAIDPVFFFETVLGVRHIDPPCDVEGCTVCKPYTRIMAESVRDNRRTIVSACHDSAKTFTAGSIFWWWILSHPPAIVVTSSSSGRQVQRGIWKEIRAHYYQSDFLKANYPEPNLEDWSYPGEPDWYGFGFSTRPDAAEAGATRVQGQHSPNLLLIFDEATAVDRLIWDAAKGSLTQPHNHWLVLANPTDPVSEFASVWRTGEGWNRIEINAYETPNLIHGDGTNPHLVTRQWVDEYIRDNGKEHPMVQARVYGRLPDEATVTLISFKDLMDAYDRPRQPRPIEGWPLVTMGVDVARFGDDLTCIYGVRDEEIVYTSIFAKRDTVFVAGQVMDAARGLGLTHASANRISVDDTGVGGGVTDICRANGWGVNPVDFGSKPNDPTRFYDRRTELWVGLRDWIKKDARLGNLTSDERRRLEADLPGVTYEMKAKGAVTLMKLEAKKDMKKRLGHSPDHGDALALALAHRSKRARLERFPAPAPERERDPRRDPPRPKKDSGGFYGDKQGVGDFYR